MHKSKKIVLSLIFIIAILLLITITLILILKSKEPEYGIGEDLSLENIQEIEANVDDKEQNRKEYFIVKDCVKQYLSSINIESSRYYGYDENNNYIKLVGENKIKSYIYNLLNKEYIKEKNITIENLYNKVSTVKELLMFVPIEINRIYNSDVKTYYVHGYAENIGDYNIVMELYLAVNLDKNNNTFSIEILEDNNSIDKIKEIKEIAENENNQISMVEVSEKEIVLDYINLYKTLVLGNPEWVYNNVLNEDYRDKRFKGVNDFKTYIENNRQKIVGIRAESYKSTISDNDTRYVITDQYGSYYIFTENEVMDYTLILDTYTIDLPEFIEKYNAGSDQQKVALNIEKFIQAINDKSYHYAYNCLADSYKNNYFKTEEEFVNYAKENFYNNSTIKFNQFNKQGEVYTYSVTLTNEETKEQKNKTFIVQLQEETDFVLSFDR